MVSVIQKTHITNKGPQKLMTIQMSGFFNVPLIARSYGGVDLGLKSHMKEAGIELMTPGWQGAQLYHYSQYFNLLNI